MNPGAEERLVNINVPQPRDHSLVEQGIFDGTGRSTQALGELCGPGFQRLGAHVEIG